MMGKVLVVGGAGYVGGGLIGKLLRSSHEVRVFDSLVYEESYRQPVEFIFGDIREWNCLEPHLRWADTVVWLAAIVGDGACALDPELTVEINERSVQRLAESFEGRILFASTCSVYGAQDGLLTEESTLNPLSIYAETKLKAEKHLSGKNSIIFRLGTLFGVSDYFSRIRLDLVINILTVKACLYNKITLFGGNQYRPLLHVKDVGEAILQNLDTAHTGIFNLHCENVRIADLDQPFLKYFPNLEIVRTGSKFQDNRNYQVSSDKARSAFGFSPRHSVDDGIGELKSIIESRRIKNISQPRHSNQRFLKDILEKRESPLGYEVRSGI